MSVQIFFFNDDQSIKRIPLRAFEGLWRRRSATAFPEYAGKRVRSAFVFLDIEGREPVKVKTIQCAYLRFDSSGRLDKEYDLAHSRAAITALPNVMETEQGDILERLKPQLMALKLRDQFKWKMSQQESRRLSAMVFQKR